MSFHPLQRPHPRPVHHLPRYMADHDSSSGAESLRWLLPDGRRYPHQRQRCTAVFRLEYRRKAVPLRSVGFLVVGCCGFSFVRLPNGSYHVSAPRSYLFSNLTYIPSGRRGRTTR